MIIKLQKFGTMLVSRQSGKEALLAFGPVLVTINDTEDVTVDFSGVITLSPSWADEFITPLNRKYKDRMILKNTSNSSVSATLKMLEDIDRISFRKDN